MYYCQFFVVKVRKKQNFILLTKVYFEYVEPFFILLDFILIIFLTPLNYTTNFKFLRIRIFNDFLLILARIWTIHVKNLYEINKRNNKNLDL